MVLEYWLLKLSSLQQPSLSGRRCGASSQGPLRQKLGPSLGGVGLPRATRSFGEEDIYVYMCMYIHMQI